MDEIDLYEKNNIDFFFAFTNVQATSVTDFEIENLIKDCLKLVQINNNINKNIKFSVILDENPNAFINENRILFITTGLIKYIPSYEALIGVLSHELGHLENYHIVKRIDSINNLKTINQLGALSAIATSILAKNSDYLLHTMIANQAGIQNYYSAFSKDQEREADIYAVQTLNKLQLSSAPLKKFLKILEKNSYQKGYNEENFMFSSHPVYRERFEIIESIATKQQYLVDKNLNKRFYFIKAKLFGFTGMNNHELDQYLIDDYYDYANSIILSRKGKLKESLIIINKLINNYPENFFILETKADLLLTHGYANEANKFYKIVFNNNKKNKYVNKRIFEIEYEQTNKMNNPIAENFFDQFSNLMLIFPTDILLYEKFKHIAYYIEKYNWVDFIDANILIANSKNDMGVRILNNILIKSKDKKLLEYTKKRINMISND